MQVRLKCQSVTTRIPAVNGEVLRLLTLIIDGDGDVHELRVVKTTETKLEFVKDSDGAPVRSTLGERFIGDFEVRGVDIERLERRMAKRY